MDRLTVTLAFAVLVAALSAISCTSSDTAAPAKATASPAAVAVPTAAAARAPMPTAEVVEELYVDLEGEPDEGAPPLTVKFTSTVEEGAPPYTYKWDFGDGTPPSTDANPTHVYQKAGEFTVTITATDSKGLTGSEELDILVESE